MLTLQATVHDGKIVLNDLPFDEGDVVEISVREKVLKADGSNPYPLRGTEPYSYPEPFEPLFTDEELAPLS